MARYTPGLDWLLPGNWLTGAPIKNLYDQAVKDHKWRIAYNDLEKDYPSDGRNRPPGTNERLRAKLKELEGDEISPVEGDIAVIKANKNNKLGSGSSIGEANARSSLLKAAEGTERRMASSSSKGSIGQNLLTLQQMRNEQTPVQTVENAAPTSTPSSAFNPNIPLDLGTARIDSNLKIPWNNMPKDFNAGAAFTNKGLQNLDLAKAGGKGGLFANAKSTANTLGAIQGILEIASNSQKKEATPSISPAEGIDEEFRFYVPSLYA